jgi:class 3 adenylate cyclase
LNSEKICEEINIHGDCVWGVFKADCVDNYGVVYHIAARLNSLLGWMNVKLKQHGYRQIKAGVGAADGNVLIVKAGYSGSSINDLIWMGDAINKASHLANCAGRNGLEPILLTESFVQKISRHRQSLVKPTKWNGVFSGNFVAAEMR